MDREKNKAISKYKDMNIQGMHYVRKLKDEKNVFSGVLVIDNNNRPVRNVYYYLSYLYKKEAYSLNSLLRISYDLCYFLDFMMFNNIDEESICYDNILEFLDIYLRIIDTTRNNHRCIQKSMLTKIPILDIYYNKRINLINYIDFGVDKNSIARIAENIKGYLVFLESENKFDIKLYELFLVKYKYSYKEGKLGYKSRELVKVYSTAGYLKKIGVGNQHQKISPIELECIFEDEEEKIFFENIKKIEYKLLFTLLSKTGMRIGEALGLKFISCKKTSENYDWTTIDSDIKLKNYNKNEWEISIIPRGDSPPDIKIKFLKPRIISFSDNTLRFANLLEDYLEYRKYILKKKRVKHDYLFINNRGTRLRYNSVYNTFNHILYEVGMGDRINTLTIHSFRHTFATKWIVRSGNLGLDRDLKLLANTLGHSSSETTKNIYYHVFQSTRNEVRKIMEESEY